MMQVAHSAAEMRSGIMWGYWWEMGTEEKRGAAFEGRGKDAEKGLWWAWAQWPCGNTAALIPMHVSVRKGNFETPET